MFYVSLRLSAVLAVLALLLVACDSGNADDAAEGDGGGEPVAVVNGEEVPAETLETRFSSMAESPQIAQQLEADQGGAMEKQLKARILNQLIQVQVMREGADEAGVEVSDEDIAERRSEIEQQLEDQGTDLQTAMEQQGLDQDDLRRELETVALQEKLVAELTSDDAVTDEDVAQYFDENKQQFQTARARQIVVESEEEAQSALERVNGGEDFAAVAEDVSIDEQTAAEGGALGEVSPAQLQQTAPALAQAIFSEGEPGELVGPVEGQQGWHVVEVQEVNEPELAEVEDDIRSQLSSGQEGEALNQWLTEQLADAEIEVAGEYGEWNAEAGQVMPDVAEDEMMMPGQPGGNGQAPPEGGGGQQELDEEEIEELEEQMQEQMEQQEGGGEE